MGSSLRINNLTTNKLPLISIIIPTFNSGENILSFLQKAIVQSYPHKEIIFVDGHSQDNTVKIIKEYAEKYPYIKFISEIDNGIYDAMNKGINLSKGEWIYFMGSDDEFYHKEVLEEVFSDSLASDYDIIYGNVSSPRFDGVYDGEFSISKILKKNICHQSIFYKKDLFKIIGYFNTNYTLLADYDFNLKWFLNTSIKRLYIKSIIANYADGGLSSISKDNLFYLEKNKNILKYGSKIFSVREKKKLCSDQAFIYRTNGYYLKSLIYYLYSLYFLIK